MKRALFLLLAALVVTACTDKPSPTIFLSFIESGPDGEHPVRMLVSDKFLRIEDGDTRDGFILFERAAH